MYFYFFLHSTYFTLCSQLENNMCYIVMNERPNFFNQTLHDDNMKCYDKSRYLSITFLRSTFFNNGCLYCTHKKYPSQKVTSNLWFLKSYYLSVFF